MENRQHTIDTAIESLETGHATPPDSQDHQSMADMLRTASERGGLGAYAAFKTAQRINGNASCPTPPRPSTGRGNVCPKPEQAEQPRPNPRGAEATAAHYLNPSPPTHTAPTDPPVRRTTMTSTPRLARSLTVFHAWWEDYDSWDGNELYLDLDTAKIHAAFSYEGEEYGHLDPDEDDEPRSTPDFTWDWEHGRWHLYDHGHATGVRVSETTVYRPATPREIEQQDALRAAEKAARAMAPHMPLAMALEHEAAKRSAPTA